MIMSAEIFQKLYAQKPEKISDQEHSIGLVLSTTFSVDGIPADPINILRHEIQESLSKEERNRGILKERNPSIHF